MRELLRSNDWVEVSWTLALLADAGIEAVVFDQHMSALEANIGAFPRRIMVREDDFARAQRLVAQARPPGDHG